MQSNDNDKKQILTKPIFKITCVKKDNKSKYIDYNSENFNQEYDEIIKKRTSKNFGIEYKKVEKLEIVKNVLSDSDFINEIYRFINEYYNENFCTVSSNKGEFYIIFNLKNTARSNAGIIDVNLNLANTFSDKVLKKISLDEFEDFCRLNLFILMAHEVYHLYFVSELTEIKGSYPYEKDNNICLRACNETLAQYFSWQCLNAYYKSKSEDYPWATGAKVDAQDNHLNYNLPKFGDGLKEYLDDYKNNDTDIKSDAVNRQDEKYLYYGYAIMEAYYRKELEKQNEKIIPPGRGWKIYDDFYDLAVHLKGKEAINYLYNLKKLLLN